MTMRQWARLSSALALATGVLLAGCSGGSTTARPGSDVSDRSSTPTATSPSESPTASDVTVIKPSVNYGALEAGRYGLAPVGAETRPLAVLDVPDGYTNDGLFLFPVGTGIHRIDACCIVAYWTVSGVYPDPCAASTRGPTDPGPTVRDLARALHAQRRTTWSRPTPVSIGGYDGLYLELSGTSLDVPTCDFGELAYWEADPGTRHVPEVGTERVWILDVAGRRVVLDIAVAPGVGTQRLQELTEIARSAHFITQ